MKTGVKLILKGIHAIDNIVDTLSFLLMSSILILTILNVFLRYVVSNPIKWYEELVVFFFVWLCMLGLSIVYRHGAHIYIDIIDCMVSPKVLSIIECLVDIIVVGILCALIVLGIEFSIQAFVKLTNILRIPYFYIDIAVPIGAGLGIMDIFAKRIKLHLGEG